jgi:diaminohydroxyphosphoribosylaminopyrimidine deaminase/5-amino-6-(5-phosphoribosylamino)uracil reductase
VREPAALSQADVLHLERARSIARAGWGRVHPNPIVGCVLVRDGEVVGEGFHASFGGPHAEIVALGRAGSGAEGATAYVSLEPCDHRGKTPPCSRALIQAGVVKVVYGAADPGAASAGGGDTLRAAGVSVVGPAWGEHVGWAENPAFFHTSVRESPFVALKLAISLDGRIAARGGLRTRITGPQAETEVHRLRTGFDAVMVGDGTVRADDPRLTARLVDAGHVPTRRFVIASEPDLPVDAALLRDVDAAPVHVFVPEDASEAAIETLETRGAHVHPVPTAADGVDLGAVQRVSWELGVRSILCEGGARLAGSLLREDRVHRLYLFVAPLTLGAGGLGAFPDDAESLSWGQFEPAYEPSAFGRDTLIVLDRRDG